MPGAAAEEDRTSSLTASRARGQMGTLSPRSMGRPGKDRSLIASAGCSEHTRLDLGSSSEWQSEEEWDLVVSARRSEHAKLDPGCLDRWGVGVTNRTLSASAGCSEHARLDPGSSSEWQVRGRVGPCRVREVLEALEIGPWLPRSMGGGVNERTLSASSRCSEHARLDLGSSSEWQFEEEWDLVVSARRSGHAKLDPGCLDRWGVGSTRGP